MIKPSVTPDDAIALLNELLVLDPAGTAILIGSRQQVNDGVAIHPTIQVQAGPDGTFFLGLLGVLNGLFGILDDGTGRGPITAIYDEAGNLERFVRSDQ